MKRDDFLSMKNTSLGQISAQEKKNVKKKPSQRNKKKLEQRKKMEQEIAAVQEKIFQIHGRRLKKNDLMTLQEFFMSGQKVGGVSYRALPLPLKKIILKMNLETLEIMKKYTKNIFARLYYTFTAWSLKKMEKIDK